MHHYTQQTLWFLKEVSAQGRKLIFSSTLEKTIGCLMSLFRDNKVTTNITYNPVQHDLKKHIKVNRHFVKERLHLTEIYEHKVYAP